MPHFSDSNAPEDMNQETSTLRTGKTPKFKKVFSFFLVFGFYF